MSIGALFGFLDKLMSKLPIQGRVERWKNQIMAYEEEKKELLEGNCNVKKVKRLDYINSELERLDRLLRNKTTD